VGLLLVLALPVAAAVKVKVTVVDKRTAEPVTGLTAGDFQVKVDNRVLPVEACAYEKEAIDVVLMLDSSQIGERIASLAPSLISQLAGSEQMAIVSYDSGAELVQDFTSSKEILLAALGRIRYGNSPALTDALYAVAADGFEDATFRRVILLLTTGVDGPASVSDEELLRVCRRDGVSVYPVYMMKYGRSKLEKLARSTGGAAFSAQQVSKGSGNPAVGIFESLRGRYELTLEGNLPLRGAANISIAGRNKKQLFVSYVDAE